MAVDKSKLEEEASVLRFYKIVLGWDYLRLLKESDVSTSIQSSFSLSKSLSVFCCMQFYELMFDVNVLIRVIV